VSGWRWTAQTQTQDGEFLAARQKAIYNIDAGSERCQSHKNPYVIKMYEDYLGEPYGSDRAHKRLHAKYEDRKHVVKHTMEEI